jgi:hypothetical protein
MSTVPIMIEVHLFGWLRRYGPTTDPTVECVVMAEAGPELRTVGDLVESLRIPLHEVASVFVDGRWQQAGLEAPLVGATRLGLFPPNMRLLYI